MEELQTDVFSYVGTAICDLISQYIGDFLETVIGHWDCSSVYMHLSKEMLRDIGSFFCNLYGI